MASFDKINDRISEFISVAATGLNKSWQFQPEHMSKR